MQPQQDQRIVTLGKITGVFGVKGWVKVYSHTAQQEDIFRYRKWYLYGEDSWRLTKLLDGKRQGKGLVACLDGINDRDQALALQGRLIGTSREFLPVLPEGQYYWADLEGLTVVTLEGQTLGEISHLFTTGANDVMVVKGDRERWLPWVLETVVKSVDLSSGSVQVDWDPDF